jgi:hypothetical protein
MQPQLKVRNESRVAVVDVPAVVFAVGLFEVLHLDIYKSRYQQLNNTPTASASLSALAPCQTNHQQGQHPRPGR